MSRLYPGWGSGKTAFEETFSVYSLACLGRDELEGGDKVIMSQSTFRKVSRMKLPFPLTFEVTNPRLSKSKAPGASKASRGAHKTSIPKKKIPDGPGKEKPEEDKKVKRKPLPRQFCGVMEFSGPEEKVFVPYWMMQNLRVKEGQKVQMKTVFDGTLPKGTLCRLQPHKTEFLDLAASMDLRELLEHAFRNYSVLSVGETIVVSFAGANYRLNVLDTQPEPAISLYGNLDLEVDFAPPLDSPDVGKLRPSSRENAVEARPDNLSFSTVPRNVQGFNQQPSPKKEEEDGPAPTAATSGHNWGTGYSLSGETVTASVPKTPQNPAAAAAIASAQPRARRRNPSKFSSRTQGSSFVGGGASLDPTKTEQTVEAATAFSGTGRTLAGGNAAPSSEAVETLGSEAPVVASRDQLRQRRLKFLENLEKKASPREEDNPTLAVGSGLNAIRKKSKS